MSLAELLNKFQKPYGIVIWGETASGDKKRVLVSDDGKLLIEGEISPTRATDHVFIPEVTVTDSAVEEVTVDSFLVSIRPQDGDIKANFDRPITSSEYTIIPKDTVKIIGRYTSKIYLQALPGQTAKVRVEGLKVT